MPIYKITSPKSGKSFNVRFDAEPSEEDIDEVADLYDSREQAEPQEQAPNTNPAIDPTQGQLGTLGNSLARGFATIPSSIASAVVDTQRTVGDIAEKYTGPVGRQVAMSLTGGEALNTEARDFLDTYQGEVEAAYPINPENEVANVVGQALPQAAGMLLGGGAGAALSKTPQAAAAAMRTVPLVMGGLLGTGQGIQQAEELGVEEPESRLAMGLLTGGIEAAIESIGGIGGKASEELISGARKKASELITDSLKSIGGEAFEEGVTTPAQNLVATAFASEDPNNPGFTKTGVALPNVDPTTKEFWKEVGLSMVGGAAGGTLFAGLNVASNLAQPDATDPFNPEAPITEDDTSAEDLTLDEATALEPPAPVVPAPEEIEKRQEAEIKEAANLKIDAVAPVITQDLAANESPLTAVAMNRALNDSNDAAEVQKAREAEIEAATAIQAAQEQAATETQTQETPPNEESILLQQASNETQADGIQQTADGQGQEEIIPAPTETQVADELDPFESPLPETITANANPATSPTDTTGTQDPFEDAPTQGTEVSPQREATVPASGGTVAPESQQEVAASGEPDAEMQELDALMERRGQAQNKVKGVRFSKRDEDRFQELGSKLRDRLFETVDPVNDSVVGEDINDKPIRQSKKGTYYTVENGRIRTAPAFKPDPEYSRQQDEILKAEKISKTSLTESQDGDTGVGMDDKRIKRLDEDLQMSGVAYDGAIRYAIKQASDETYYVEKTQDGQRESISTGHSDIDTARNAAISGIRNQGLESQAGVESNQPDAGVGAQRGAGDKATSKSDGSNVQESNAPNKPVIRRTGAKVAGASVSGQQSAAMNASRIATLRLLNQATNAYPNEDFNGIDPSQIDEVRDYMISIQRNQPPTQESWEQSPESQQEVTSKTSLTESQVGDTGGGMETTTTKPVSYEQVQGRIQELLRAPTASTKKPAVSFKTQTEERAFALGFENATKRQGEPLPKMMSNRSAKDQRWDDAWAMGWSSGQTFIRSLPAPESEPKTITQLILSGEPIDAAMANKASDVTIRIMREAGYSKDNDTGNWEITNPESKSQEPSPPPTQETWEQSPEFQAAEEAANRGDMDEAERIEAAWNEKNLAPTPESKATPKPKKQPTKKKETPAPSAPSRESEAEVAISPKSSPKTPKQGRPTVAKVDVAESPKTDTKSTEQKRLEAQLEKVEADILDAEADGDERGADGLRAAKLKIERQLEDITQSIPASTIKQGDTIRFKQEGQTLSGTYVGPVNQSGKQVYEVQVAGEPRSRRVTAQSINGSNDAQLEGTMYSRINNEQGTRLNGPEANIGNNKRGENETNGASVRGNISPQEGGEDSLGLSPGDNSERANAIRNAVSGIDWKNATAAERIKALADFSSRVASGFVQLPAESNLSISYASKNGNLIGARVVGISNGRLLVEINTGPDTINSNTHKWDNPEAAFAYAYDVMQEESIHALQHAIAFRRWKAIGSPGKFEKFSNQRQVDSFREALRQYSSFVKSGDITAAQKIQRALLDSWNLYRDLNNPVNSINELVDLFMKDERVAVELMPELTRQLVQLTREDFTTETGWRKFFNQVKGWIQDAINSLKAVLPLARNGDLGPIIQQDIKELESMMRDYRDGKPMDKYSRQRTTRPKTQGLERKVAEKYLKKLGVPSSKVYLVDEPSFKWRGRYDPSGSIGINLAYTNSVEELNDTLLRHEAIHDAVETSPKVKQRAIELLDALTPDELSIINESIQGYSDAEMQDEQIVEAVRLMTSRRPDLRTKWARFVEAVTLAIKKFLGIKNLDRQVAELTAARILARGRDRVMRGKMGGRDKFSGNMYAGDAVTAAKDAEYLAAVEAGDMSKAQGMVDEAAKGAGYTIEAYKAMPERDWKTGEPINIIDSRNGPWAGFFTDTKTVADRFGRIMRTPVRRALLKIEKPFEIDATGKAAGELQFDIIDDSGPYKQKNNAQALGAIKSGEYDAIILKNTTDEGTVSVPLYPNQIKSADPVTYDSSGNVIPLSQRFQPESPDIRYSRVNDSIPTQGEPTATESQLRGIAERTKIEQDIADKEGGKKPKRKRVFGVDDAGRIYTPENMETAKQAAKGVFNGETMTLDAAGKAQWERIMEQYSVSTPGSGGRVLSLIESGNEMAPTALQTELGIFAERYTDATKDPAIFKRFVNEVNDLLSVIGGITSAARAMANRRWSPLTERWGAYLKVNKEIEQNGPPNIDKIKKRAKEEALDNLDNMEIKDSTIKRLLAKAKGDVTWSEFFTENPRDKQKDRQREIYIKILGSDKFKELSRDERLELTKALDKIWRQEHGRVFLREFEKKIPLKNPKLKKQLAAQAPALLKAINLGTFDSQAYRKEISKTYGLKDLSDADLVKVIKLGAEIQDARGESLAQRKKIEELANLVSGVTNIPKSHILASYYISSILASGRTGIGAMFSILEVAIEAVVGVAVSATKSPTQAMAGLNAAFKAFPRGVLEGLSHFRTGDKTGTLLATDSFNQWLKGEGYSPISLGELLWKEKNPVKKFAGVVIIMAERMLTGIDIALSSTLHEASMVWANSITEFKDSKGNTVSLRNPTAADKERMRRQVIAEWFGGVEPPKTLENLAKINAGMRDQIERFYIDEDPSAGLELVKGGRRTASGPSFQGDVTGAIGFLIKRINGVFADTTQAFEKYAEKNNIGPIERAFAGLGVGSFALVKSFLGLQFVSFIGKLINRNLQFVPGSALVPKWIYGENMSQYERKSIIAKNAMGLGLITVTLAYILSDDDDEERTMGAEGDWSSLSGEQRDAKRTAGAIPSSFWFRDENGQKIYISFANSSLSWIFTSVANLREIKVNNPEKWKEASDAAIASEGIVGAIKSVFNTSATGRLAELLGGSPFSKSTPGAGSEKLASSVATFAGGFVPSIIRELDYMMDPSYYEPKTLAERAVSVIPFLRRQVAESQGSLGVLGTPAQINRSPTSRVYSSGADTEAEKILARMADEGLYLPLPDDKKGRDHVSPVSGRKIQMTKPQIMEYVKLVGEDYARFILRDGENLMTMDRDKAKERISKASSDIKTRAARMSMRIRE